MNIFKGLFLFAALCIASVPVFAGETVIPVVPEYNLSVSFDIAASKIMGVAVINAQTPLELAIHAGRLKILEITVNGKILNVETGEDFSVHADGPVRIVYEGVFSDSDSDNISVRGILLRGCWYPIVKGPFVYHLKALLPKGFEAVSEAERIVRTAGDGTEEFNFDFSHPLYDTDGITLIASKDYVVTRDKYKDTELYAYFLPEEAPLARKYLEAAKDYLAFHEKSLTPFPYRRFSIVESFQSSAFSMPTFILMSRDELRLPSVEVTALGHELVHQWFGNYVYTDYDLGNWNEGLTIYFADHYYQEKKGKGRQCRRRILSGFQSYVSEKNDFPLTAFSERTDDASRLIGYGKSAMVAHMLRKLSGDAVFFAAVRDFLRQNAFRVASWDDIRVAFEKRMNVDLTPFFAQWLRRTGVPSLAVEDLRVSETGRRYTVSFAVVQKTAPYSLNIPVSIHYKGGVLKALLTLEEAVSRFSFVVEGRPLEVVLDENYDVFRALTAEENPPTFERLLIDDGIVLVPPATRKGLFRDIIEAFGAQGVAVKMYAYRSGYGPVSRRKDYGKPDLLSRGNRHSGSLFSRDITEVKDEELKNYSLVILGGDNPVAKRLFGEQAGLGENVSVMIKRNPLNPEKVVALIENPLGIKTVTYLKHMTTYPFYSNYVFREDKSIEKSLEANEQGIRIKLE